MPRQKDIHNPHRNILSHADIQDPMQKRLTVTRDTNKSCKPRKIARAPARKCTYTQAGIRAHCSVNADKQTYGCTLPTGSRQQNVIAIGSQRPVACVFFVVIQSCEALQMQVLNSEVTHVRYNRCLVLLQDPTCSRGLRL